MSRQEVTAVERVIHELVDIAAGRIPRLTHARASELHESVTPGFNDRPLTEAEQAQLKALQERQAREQQKAQEPAPEQAPAAQPPAQPPAQPGPWS